LYGTFILLDIQNSLDSKDTSKSSIVASFSLLYTFIFIQIYYNRSLPTQIDQSSFILPGSLLEEPGRSPTLIKAYADYIAGTAKVMRDFLKSGATDAKIDQEAEAVWKFESELVKVRWAELLL